MPSGAKTLTVEELIALNDEIAAISRMGVPLEMGLRGLGQELPGRLGQAMKSLEQKLASGQNLSEALDQSILEFPPAYQAIVLAGLESGRLSSALECVARSARRVHELRSSTRMAFFYPMLVMAVAYSVFVFFCITWTPALVDFYDDSALGEAPLLEYVKSISNSVGWWAPILPLAISAVVLFAFARSRRSTRYPFRSLRKGVSIATFTELLASLVERSVPLSRAVRLAAAGSGSSSIERESESLAERLERGESMDDESSSGSAIPSWIVWLLQNSRGQQQLARNLHRAARGYHDDVRRQVQWYMKAFPIWIIVLVGSTATLSVALFLIGPWLYVLTQLGAP
jgi:general secretion pathway protein F